MTSSSTSKGPVTSSTLDECVAVAKTHEQQLIFLTLQHVVKKEEERFGKNEFAKQLLSNDALEQISLKKRRVSTKTIPAQFQKHYHALSAHIERIIKLAELETKKIHKTKVFAKRNQSILFEVRKALKNPVYQFLNEEESLPAIHFLHAICLSSLADPYLLDAFLEVGKKLRCATHEDEKKKGSSVSFAELIHKARQAGYRRGLIKEDISLEYVWKYFHEAWGTFLSTTFGRKLVRLFGLKKYDPRGDLQNNVGAFFDVRLCIKDQLQNKVANAQARVVYTPTPTIGDEVAPEVKAVLQAMENRHFMTRKELEKDPYPYLCWVYANLQNRHSEYEGTAVCNIMKLNYEYPLSFRGITVTQDSQFYKAGIHGHIEWAIEQAIFDEEGLTAAYKEAQKKELLDPSNFTLDSQVHAHTAGYYFPGDISQWKEVLLQIVDLAYEKVISQKVPQVLRIDRKKWNWYQKAAFRELVNMGIISYYQAKVASSVSGLLSPDLHGIDIGLLFTCACKESIDRGAKTNAAFLWAQGDASQEIQEQVFSALHARALLTRRRLILASRVEPLYALVLILPQNLVHKMLQDVQAIACVSAETAKPLKNSFEEVS